MKAELEMELLKKYPKIFRQHSLPIEETCMCWGIETGDGWFWLIDQLCASIQGYINGFTVPEYHQIEAVQVKEKYGTLRFYITGGDDIVEGMIWLAESMSAKICERCGSTENVTPTSGWIRYLCENCHENDKNNRGSVSI